MAAPKHTTPLAPVLSIVSAPAAPTAADPFETPPAGLTAKWIESRPLPDRRREVGDQHATGRGLAIRFESTGAKSFFHKHEFIRPDGTKYRPTCDFGKYHPTKDLAGYATLLTARKRLAFIKEAAEGGIESFERARQRLEAEIAGVDYDASRTPTVYVIGEALYEEIRPKDPTDKKGWRSHKTLRRLLDKAIYRFIRDTPVASVTPAQCREIVEWVATNGLRPKPRPAPTQGGKVLACLSSLFNFATGRGDMTVDGKTYANPCATLTAKACKASNGEAADRPLSFEEIPMFWRYLDSFLGARLGPAPQTLLCLRILLLTGVRPCELLLAERDEVDLKNRIWRIPPEHRKMNPEQRLDKKVWVDWYVPLSAQVVPLFEELYRVGGESRLVVVPACQSPTKRHGTHAGKRTEGGESKPQHEAVLWLALQRFYDRKRNPLKLIKPERLTPYDLRHTLRTHLEILGTEFGVAERCLCHSLGKIPKHYITPGMAPPSWADYFPQRAKALQTWADLVFWLVDGNPVDEFPALRAYLVAQTGGVMPPTLS